MVFKFHHSSILPPSFWTSFNLHASLVLHFPLFFWMLQLLLDFFCSISLLFNIDFPIFLYILKKLEFFPFLYVIVALMLFFPPFYAFQCRYSFHFTSLSFIMFFVMLLSHLSTTSAKPSFDNNMSDLEYEVIQENKNTKCW